ncbi:MAG: hypothetical protein KDC33_06240 [Thermoleophilia bacterium]|nr:hypothetical protein [Thermoleophilia bacterium]
MNTLRAALVTVAASAPLLLATPAVAFTARLNGQVIPPKRAATLTVTTPAAGQFAYWLRASSDGQKRLRLVQRRGTSAFTVLRVPGSLAGEVCEGAAGSLYCTGFTAPAPRRATYRIRVFNDASRPLTVTLRLTFTRVRGD